MISRVLIIYVLSGIVLLFAGNKARAQDSAAVRSSPDQRVKVLPLPTFGYEPETATQVGAVGLFTFDPYNDPDTRTSNAKLEVTYTWRRQVIFESAWDYFFRKEKWMTRGLIHFSRYPDLYYGIGTETSEADELQFDSERIIADINIIRNLGSSYFGGMGVRYHAYSNVSSDSLNPYPELQDNSVFGLRATFLKDTRNSILSASKGSYLAIGSDFNFAASNYVRTIIDLRKYNTFAGSYTLALRFYNSFNHNTPAFFDYSILGGDKYVRGYFYGRFRDRHLSTVQAEFRMPVVWRFGIALIGGVSSLYPDFMSISAGIRPNYGCGIRFVMDRKQQINLRFDFVAGSRGHRGIYFGFGESF